MLEKDARNPEELQAVFNQHISRDMEHRFSLGAHSVARGRCQITHYACAAIVFTPEAQMSMLFKKWRQYI